MTTPKLSMPELVVGQAGKELTHNQALAILDQLAQAVVVDKDLTAPPGSPANGAMYIVAAGATGAWAGQDGKLAFWLTTVAAWTFITPADGWRVWVADEATSYGRQGGAWVLGGALGLGTAAFANITTSNTDTTAGRLLKVGDFGLGTVNAGWVTYDLNTIPATGFYFVNGASTNLPAPGAFGTLLHMERVDEGFQLFTQAGIPNVAKTWQRTKVTSTWGAWVEVATSASGLIATVDTARVGYGVGSGGTVTQATSKATAVTLNKPTGKITMNGAALAENTAVSFTLNCNAIAIPDTPIVTISSGATAGAYLVMVDAQGAGTCRISVRNMTGGSLSEAIVLQYNILKGAIA